MKYKFCYKCRKLIPGEMYNHHKVIYNGCTINDIQERLKAKANTA